ncbi:GTP cyclohydrolase II-domain-containing protein [Lipomyces oligophaga]|uniref:GTP cyclohydrolase II-domain-containing protein n=1 Tax=Lipomyces oligophaga TaxID=45792 RepID=UPI0034CD3F42
MVPSQSNSNSVFPSHVSPRISPQFKPVEIESDISLSTNEQLPPLVTPLPTRATTPGPVDLTPIPITSTPEPAPSLPEVLPKVECVVRARIPTTTGTEIFLHLYKNNVDEKEHLAIVFGPHIRSKSLDRPRPGETERDRMIRGAYTGRLYPGRKESGKEDLVHLFSKQDHATLVRIHSECYTGETAWSARCDCGEQLDEAARLMTKENDGVVVYLRQEGRGIGLLEKLKAYNLQDLGADTVTANLLLRHPADARSYSIATAILLDLDLTEIRLLTNNPDKIAAVEGKHKEIKVTDRVPMVPLAWSRESGGIRSQEVEGYLKTKIEPNLLIN